MPDRDIPSIAEIRKATNILSSSDASTTVVKIGDLAIKYGNGATLLEAQTLDYVSKNSAVPAPKLVATLTEPETDSTFIVMEYAEGAALFKLLERSERR